MIVPQCLVSPWPPPELCCDWMGNVRQAWTSPLSLWFPAHCDRPAHFQSKTWKVSCTSKSWISGQRESPEGRGGDVYLKWGMLWCTAMTARLWNAEREREGGGEWNEYGRLTDCVLTISLGYSLANAQSGWIVQYCSWQFVSSWDGFITESLYQCWLQVHWSPTNSDFWLSGTLK